MTQIRIVIADDHRRFRDSLQQVIDAEPDMHVVAAVGDGTAALDEIRRLLPDVALLDVRMPGLDGVDIARRITGDGLCTRAVIVTMYGDRAVVARAMAAGARGYVLKDAALSEVVGAVRLAMSGGTYVTPGAGTVGDET